MYSHSVQDICPTHMQKTSALVNFIRNEKKGLVLNLGCGTGKHTVILQNLGFNVISLDSDENCAREVKKISNCVVIGDASLLPFKKSVFDKLICIDVLEHVKNDIGCLEEIKNTVKKGGTIIISIPMKNYPFLYDPVNKMRMWLGMKPGNFGLYAWGHQRLYDETFVKTIRKKFEILDSAKKSSLIIGIIEGYWPYLFVYHFSKFSKKTMKIPCFVMRLAELICKIDDIFFSEKLGYINHIFKLRNQTKD